MYHIVGSYQGTFIGQVAIVNTGDVARDWTALVDMQTSVGTLSMFRLESLPQPTVTQPGRTFNWRSTTPLAAGTTCPPRFQFDGGGTQPPDRCRVYGKPLPRLSLTCGA